MLVKGALGTRFPNVQWAHNPNDGLFVRQTMIQSGHDFHLSPWQWRHIGCDSVSNHQPHDCLLNCLFRRRSKKISKLRVTGLCAGNSPGTGEFPAQMASNAENASIWWRHHVLDLSMTSSGTWVHKVVQRGSTSVDEEEWRWRWQRRRRW